MYPFFESIKVEDQKIFLLDLHQKRVDETYAHFGSLERIDLRQIFEKLSVDENGLFKLRISYDLQGNYEEKLLPYAISEIGDFQLVVDDHLEYQYKSENRDQFHYLKKKASADEIIIVKNGSITDTSFSNLLFLKNKVWYTPKTFLLNGVMRKHLLQNDKIQESDITLNTLREYSHFQLINAMNDFDDMFIYPMSKIINLPKQDQEEYL